MLLEELNDDCLLVILAQLNFVERVKVERVCGRWLSLVELMFEGHSVLGTRGSTFECDHVLHRVDRPNQLIDPRFTRKRGQMSKLLPHFSSLKTLVLNSLKLDNEVLETVLYKLPLLEHLELRFIQHFDRPSSPETELTSSLKHLVLNDCSSHVIIEMVKNARKGCLLLEEVVIIMRTFEVPWTDHDEFLHSLHRIRAPLKSFLYKPAQYKGYNADYMFTCLLSGPLRDSLLRLAFDFSTGFFMVDMVSANFRRLESLDMTISRRDTDEFFATCFVDTFDGVSELKLNFSDASIDFMEDPFESHAIDKLVAFFPNLRSLLFTQTVVKNRDLEGITVSCPLLEKLVIFLYKENVVGTNLWLGDKGLQALEGLQRLQHLALSGSDITDDGLNSFLRSSHSIRHLETQFCQKVTNRTLKCFSQMASKYPQNEYRLLAQGSRICVERQKIPPNVILLLNHFYWHQDEYDKLFLVYELAFQKFRDTALFEKELFTRTVRLDTEGMRENITLGRDYELDINISHLFEQ